MALTNPIYIDQDARHRASQVRLLAYQAMEGQQGVLLAEHLKVKALGTPGAAITADPGGYAVNAKHTGGSFESYLGKINSASEIGSGGSVPVSAVSSGGSRTDLVILRIENPYVVGSGSWSIPTDPVEGPYAHIRVIENVPANTNAVEAVDATWSAITLARIVRPASTGIVQDSHIEDLRSIARVGGQRITIITTPPASPPPIAEYFFIEAHRPTSLTTLLASNTTYIDFPAGANWDVPIPSTATHMEINAHIYNAYVYAGDIWGTIRIIESASSTQLISAEFDVNNTSGFIDGTRETFPVVAQKFAIPSSWRGTIKNLKMQAKQYASMTGRIESNNITTLVAMQIFFKRSPI
jgi:hypothetical protein